MGSSKSSRVKRRKSKWSHESLMLKSKSSCKSLYILSSRVWSHQIHDSSLTRVQVTWLESTPLVLGASVFKMACRDLFCVDLAWASISRNIRPHGVQLFVQTGFDVAKIDWLHWERKVIHINKCVWPDGSPCRSCRRWSAFTRALNLVTIHCWGTEETCICCPYRHAVAYFLSSSILGILFRGREWSLRALTWSR